MKNYKKKLIFVVPLASSFLLVAFVLCIFLFRDRIADTLARTQKIQADVLIFEGWLPESHIATVNDEFNSYGYELIVTTGIKSNELDYCKIPMNGYLIFYPTPGLFIDQEIKNHKFDILSHSEMGGKYSSHFNFFINDTLWADFIADDQERKYSIYWKGALKDIDSLMVHFDDDYLDEGGDKNLYVKEIQINDSITLGYKYNSVYDIGRLGGTNRIANNYDYESEQSRIKIIASGIHPSSIIATTGENSRINRTLQSALAFRSWLENYGGNVNGINIMSGGIHSRRTMITYKSILEKKIEIGIICLKEPASKGFPKYKFKDILSEMLNLIYYRIILIPYALNR